MPVGTSAMVALANITLGSSAASVTFSSISGSYRDLVIVYSGTSVSSSSNAIGLRFNGDSGSNYSDVFMYGTGSSAASGSQALTFVQTMRTSSTQSDGIANIMDYSATDKHKTVISRGNTADAYTIAYASRWANTAAITSIVCINAGGNNFAAGSTFSLYGVSA